MTTVKEARHFSLWLLLGLTSLLLAVTLDVIAIVTEGWASETSEMSSLGIWRLCGKFRQLDCATSLVVVSPGSTSPPNMVYTCLSPFSMDLGWYKAGVVMEIMGLIASVGVLFAGVATLVMVKHQGHWLDGRGPVAALIPLAAISGFFNFAGGVTVARGLPDVQATAGFSLALDLCAAIIFGIGTTFCVLDLQGVGWRRKHRQIKITGFPV